MKTTKQPDVLATNLESGSKGVELVDRALTILTCFRDGDVPLALAEISLRTGLYKSTILRLLASLEAFGFVCRHSDKTYTPGWAVMRLGALYQQSFRLEHHVRPVLVELRNATGESASFYRREGNNRLCLFREESIHMLRDHISEGAVLPLDRGAAGHVLIRFGSNSAGSMHSLSSLPSIPITSFGERDPEIVAIAVPVLGREGGAIGALTISGPVSRLDASRTKTLGPLLVHLGRKLSQRLGSEELSIFEKVT